MDAKQSSNIAYRRRKQIEDGLYAMLLAAPIGEITISDLCTRLGITRKVFYRHFRDKEDCLCSIMDNVIRDSLVSTIRNIPHLQMSLESAAVIVEYWKDQKGFLDILLRDHLLELFMARVFVLARQEDETMFQRMDNALMACDSDIMGCFLTCHYALILQWHARRYDTPVEEMAKKYLRITQYPLLTVDNREDSW